MSAATLQNNAAWLAFMAGVAKGRVQEYMFQARTTQYLDLRRVHVRAARRANHDMVRRLALARVHGAA